MARTKQTAGHKKHKIGKTTKQHVVVKEEAAAQATAAAAIEAGDLQHTTPSVTQEYEAQLFSSSSQHYPVTQAAAAEIELPQQEHPAHRPDRRHDPRIWIHRRK